MRNAPLTANQDVTVKLPGISSTSGNGTTAANLQWRSTVQMEKAEAQVIANGTTRVVWCGKVTYGGLLALADGENRIEATVVPRCGQSPAQWRFELGEP